MKKYYSEICEAMHQDAMAEFEAGLISEAEMRQYDDLCLVEEPETACEENPAITEHVTAILGQ